MRGSESFRKTVTLLIYLFFFQNLEIISFSCCVIFLLSFYFFVQKLKQKAEQDNADELQSVNEVLESYGY